MIWQSLFPIHFSYLDGSFLLLTKLLFGILSDQILFGFASVGESRSRRLISDWTGSGSWRLDFQLLSFIGFGCFRIDWSYFHTGLLINLLIPNNKLYFHTGSCWFDGCVFILTMKYWCLLYLLILFYC